MIGHTFTARHTPDPAWRAGWPVTLDRISLFGLQRREPLVWVVDRQIVGNTSCTRDTPDPAVRAETNRTRVGSQDLLDFGVGLSTFNEQIWNAGFAVCVGICARRADQIAWSGGRRGSRSERSVAAQGIDMRTSDQSEESAEGDCKKGFHWAEDCLLIGKGGVKY